jgi:hypothetical protein
MIDGKKGRRVCSGLMICSCLFLLLYVFDASILIVWISRLYRPTRGLAEKNTKRIVRDMSF